MTREDVRRLLRRNWLGKQGCETWGDWIDRGWRGAACRLLGHTRPVRRFTGYTCGRCFRVIRGPGE